MGTFTLTNKAKTDLKSIATYTQRKWGENQRRIYLKQFDDAFHLLADTPEVGTQCDFIKLGYRKFLNASHVIFYRILDKTQIEVIRILHKRMEVLRDGAAAQYGSDAIAGVINVILKDADEGISIGVQTGEY